MYLLILASFTISAILGAALIRHHCKNTVSDTHDRFSGPATRHGGAAIIIAFFCGVAILYGANLLPYYVFAALAGGGGIIGLVEYLGNKGTVSPQLKAASQTASLIWGIFWLGPVPYIEVSDFVWQWGFFGVILTMIGGLWLINLFRFMDGIDGLVATQAIFIFASAALFCLGERSYGQAWTLGVLAASVAGFSVFNWPPAKLLLSGIGTGFLGLMIVLLAIATTPPLTLWPWAILVTVFVADSTVTFVRCLLRGEGWRSGRNLHAYQHLAQRWRSQKIVVIGYMVFNLTLVFPLALFAWSDPTMGAMACAVAWSLAFLAAFFLGAGAKQDSRR